MNPLLRHFLVSFRLGLAMVCGLLGVEALGQLGFSSSPFPFFDLGQALLLGSGAVLVNAAGIAVLTALLRLEQETAERFTSLSVALGLLYLILVQGLGVSSFSREGFWLTLLALVAVLGIVLGLGRFLYFYFSQGAPDLAQAKFQALAPVSVLASGFYSIAHDFILTKSRLTLALLGIIIFIIIGQYLFTRVIWARKREPLSRWGVRLHYLVIILVLAWASVGSAWAFYQKSRPATASPHLPSVILISIDTLRADFLSVNNPQAAPTPAFDALAKDGINFSHAMSASCWTPPGVAGFLTGLYPAANGSGQFIPLGHVYDFTGPLATSPALAEEFADQGYVTAAVVHNYWLTPTREFSRGFKTYQMIGDPALYPQFLLTQGFQSLQRRLRPAPPNDAAKVFRQVQTWLHHRPAGPFFLWIHYVDPHLPYAFHKKYPPRTPPGPMTPHVADSYNAMQVRYGLFNLTAQDHQYLRERYEGEIRYMDEELGRLLNELKELGLYERSIIALTSDHGEEFWEHGNFEHGHGFHNELIHVPLIIKLPGRQEAGKVVSHFVSTTRLGATLLSAAGIKSDFPGPSLFSEEPSSDLLAKYWLSQAPLAFGEKGALGDGEGHTALLHKDGSITCYDLNLDPAETMPFPEAACPWPSSQPSPREIFQLFAEKNQRLFKSLGGDQARRRSSSPAEIQRLKALGYLK